MLVIEHIAELIDGKIVNQVVKQSSEIGLEQIVELMGEQVVEMVVKYTAVMARANFVARLTVATEESMAIFEIFVEATCLEQTIFVVAVDVENFDAFNAIVCLIDLLSYSLRYVVFLAQLVDHQESETREVLNQSSSVDFCHLLGGSISSCGLMGGSKYLF